MIDDDDLDPQAIEMNRLIHQVEVRGAQSLTLEEAYALRAWIQDVYLSPASGAPPDYRPVAALVKALLDGAIAMKEAEQGRADRLRGVP